MLINLHAPASSLRMILSKRTIYQAAQCVDELGNVPGYDVVLFFSIMLEQLIINGPD